MIIKLLLILQVLVLIYIFITFLNRKRLKNLCERSKYEISKLGTNISLVGATGDGKTTTGAGISNYLIEIIIGNCLSRMDKIRKQLYYINFNLLQQIYVQYLDIYSDFDLALLKVLDYYESEDKLDIYSTDYLSVESAYQLVRDYILYFNIANIQKSFIFSKGYFIDRVTCNISKLFDSSSIELRNVLSEKNFQMAPGLIIFDDEKSLERGNVYSNNKDIKLSGSKEFFALLRNMFKELSYHVVMKQQSDDEVKQERVLINASLMIFDRKDFISSFPLLKFFISFPLKIIKLFIDLYGLFYDFFHSNEKKKYGPFVKRYNNKFNLLRRLEYMTYMSCSLLSSISYIRVRMFRYYRSDDVGKRTPNTFDRLILYFPIQYCYGCIDTWEYSQSAYPIFDAARINHIDASVSKFDSSPRLDRVKKIFEKEV